MRRAHRFAAWLVVLAVPAAAEPVPRPPSGQPIVLIDFSLGNADADPDLAGAIDVRFRFLATEIARQGGTISTQQALADMEFLCNIVVLPQLSALPPAPVLITISLSDRVVPFGQAMPEATQYFEVFSVEGGTCAREMF